MMTLTAVALVLCLSVVAACVIASAVPMVAMAVFDPDIPHWLSKAVAVSLLTSVAAVPVIVWYTFVFKVVPLMGVL
jgi:hypothetical protein